MMVEAVLTLGFLLLFRALTREVDWSLRLLLWCACFLHLAVVVGAHLSIVQTESTGIIYDQSVDAQTYYETARALADRPLFSISRLDISQVSGTVWHMGYQYLVITCMKVSEQPMLLVRLVKVYLYFLCLAALATFWIQRFGLRATYIGITYLSLLWWEIAYYNVRNIRDSLIVCLSILIYLCWQRLLDHDARRSGRTLLLTVVALVVCLLVLAQFRVYMLAVLAGGIGVDFLMRRGRGAWKRAMVMAAIAIAAFFALNIDAFFTMGLLILQEGLGTQSPVTIGLNVIKATIAPIPWQYAQGFLIPSQCFYLGMIAVAIWAVARLRTHSWGEVFTVAALVLFMSVGLESAYARKRMPVVPILAGWMVRGIAASSRNRLHGAGPSAEPGGAD